MLPVALPMTKAPATIPKRVDCPSLRHCHREAIPNCHRGNAYALKPKDAVWCPNVVHEAAIAEFRHWLAYQSLTVSCSLPRVEGPILRSSVTAAQ
jgi:hypothetical protein